MNRKTIHFATYSWLLVGIVLIGISCGDDVMVVDKSLTHIPYNPSPYEIDLPEFVTPIQGAQVHIPEVQIPPDNPMTEEGIELGRYLFFDTLLSADYTMSCASCHIPKGVFTDNKATSEGIDGVNGDRSSMSLHNVAFFDNGLFWDGRAATLEEQALAPVENEIELHNTWDTVVARLKRSEFYGEKFRKAFGIQSTGDITKELAVKAIAQFERTIISFESKFDRYLRGLAVLDDDELYGLEIYFDIEGSEGPDGQCWHCHGLPLMSSNAYFNNGLSRAETIYDFPDPGRGKIIDNPAKNGFFRTPSLRNIELTAPYMHDGSLKTLDEVIDHYNSGGEPSPSKDPLVKDIHLSDYDKIALKKFLLTLTDTVLIHREDLQNPFR